MVLVGYDCSNEEYRVIAVDENGSVIIRKAGGDVIPIGRAESYQVLCLVGLSLCLNNIR